MSRQTLLLIGILGAAIGVPYLLLDDGLGLTKLTWKGPQHDGALAVPAMSTASFGDAGPLAPGEVSPVTGQPMLLAPPGIEGPRVGDFSEVIRFDVTPKWVLARWTRVSTQVAELDLEGMRVPLVTGTRPDDLAGSLTYYFDKKQQVQRITFEGVVGDERRLVNFVTAQYKLKAEPTLGAGLYVAKWSGRPQSALRVSYAAVVRNDATNSRCEVLLELNRSGSKYGLSVPLQAVLNDDRQNRRW